MDTRDSRLVTEACSKSESHWEMVLQPTTKSGFQGDLELIDLESMIAELTVDFIGEF